MKLIKVIIPTVLYVEVSEQEAEACKNAWGIGSLDEAYKGAAFDKAHERLLEGQYDDLDGYETYEI